MKALMTQCEACVLFIIREGFKNPSLGSYLLGVYIVHI